MKNTVNAHIISAIIILCIVVLAGAIILLLSSVAMARKGKYKLLFWLMRHFGIIVDPSGYLTPEYAAFLAIQGKDYDLARTMMTRATAAGYLSVHYLLAIQLAASEGDWEAAQTVMKQLELTQQMEKDMESDLRPLAEYVEHKDVLKILGMCQISGFGKCSYKDINRHDLPD